MEIGKHTCRIVKSWKRKLQASTEARGSRTENTTPAHRIWRHNFARTGFDDICFDAIVISVAVYQNFVFTLQTKKSMRLLRIQNLSFSIPAGR